MDLTYYIAYMFMGLVALYILIFSMFYKNPKISRQKRRDVLKQVNSSFRVFISCLLVYILVFKQEVPFYVVMIAIQVLYLRIALQLLD